METKHGAEYTHGPGSGRGSNILRENTASEERGINTYKRMQTAIGHWVLSRHFVIAEEIGKVKRVGIERSRRWGGELPEAQPSKYT